MLKPGMIQFSAVDLGEMRPDWDSPVACGIGGSSTPKKKQYPSIHVDQLKERVDLPDSGEGRVKFRVLRREERIGADGGKVHGATIEVQSIDVDDKRKSVKSPVAVKTLSALRVGMIELADGRPRNGQGQFAPEEGSVPGPNTMAAAYGGVEEEKKERRIGLLGRLSAMMPRGK